MIEIFSSYGFNTLLISAALAGIAWVCVLLSRL
jgi:hypothetical protein